MVSSMSCVFCHNLKNFFQCGGWIVNKYVLLQQKVYIGEQYRPGRQVGARFQKTFIRPRNLNFILLATTIIQPNICNLINMARLLINNKTSVVQQAWGIGYSLILYGYSVIFGQNLLCVQCEGATSGTLPGICRSGLVSQLNIFS